MYEGEQEGPYQVAVNLLEKAIRTQFIQYFPNPEAAKKKKSTGKQGQAQAVQKTKIRTKPSSVGSMVAIILICCSIAPMPTNYMRCIQVDGLHAFVKKYYPQANDKENALLMEFVLHGLSSYSLISKKMLEGKIEFKDLMGSMMNFGAMNFEDDLTEDDFK